MRSNNRQNFICIGLILPLLIFIICTFSLKVLSSSGKKAARVGDTTAHGGIIIEGYPAVLIEGKPAARIGDMHTCPQVIPGPQHIPHVGGRIITGSRTVLIGGKPAARVGDTATCQGPADIIIEGSNTVLIGD